MSRLHVLHIHLCRGMTCMGRGVGASRQHIQMYVSFLCTQGLFTSVIFQRMLPIESLGFPFCFLSYCFLHFLSMFLSVYQRRFVCWAAGSHARPWSQIWILSSFGVIFVISLPTWFDRIHTCIPPPLPSYMYGFALINLRNDGFFPRKKAQPHGKSPSWLLMRHIENQEAKNNTIMMINIPLITLPSRPILWPPPPPSWHIDRTGKHPAIDG